jgi:class 3 adenylate cyclase/DNA-binding response OmpR family regulator
MNMPPTLTNMTNVLVIDDDLETQRLLERLGSEDDLCLILALTSEEGLRLALEKEPDIIVLNAALPGADGLGGLLTLRGEVQDTPIIVTTEHHSADQAVSAFRWGACDYLSKPLDLQELKQAIQRALRTSDALKERDRLTQRLLETTETLQRQQQELNAVHVIGRLTTSLLDLDVVLERLTEIAVHLTDAQESILLLRDQGTDELYLRAAKTLGRELLSNFRMTLDGMGAGRAVRTRRPVLVTGDQARIIPGRESEALLYMPLQVPDRVIGLLGLSSRESKDAFSQRDVYLLSTLVDYAAIAIENARLFESTANAKSLMDAVFSSIGSGVVTVDADDRITLINRAARQILRAPSTEVGLRLRDAFPAFERQVRPLIERVKQDDEPQGPVEIDMSLESDDMVNLLVNLAPLRLSSENHATKVAAGQVTDHSAHADPSGLGKATRAEAGIGGVTIVVDDVTTQRKLESRFRLFQRYLSPNVIERLPDDPQELELGGVRQEIACLFADLRGFVDFSIRHPPEKLVETLNEYLGAGAEAVLSEEGTLDKFVGDAVVAFFNAPLAQEDYVMRAVRAAIKIREATAQLHKKLDPGHQLTYGIGISVGTAIVGNIGTPRRLDYTAIGPSVNMANRLQAVAEPGQILMTAEVYGRVKEQIIAHPILLENLTGSQAPTTAYALVGLAASPSLPSPPPRRTDRDA